MSDVEPAAEAPPEQVDEAELRASLAHDEWANAMRRAGWRYGPELDLPALTHPYLVPWAQLPAEAQEHHLDAATTGILG